MRLAQYHPLAEQLHQQVIGLIQQQLRPRDFSKKCPAWVLLSCLVLAAAHRLALSAVAAVRRRCPSRETLRQALYATLPAYDALRRRLPALLRASLPRGLRKHPGRRRYAMALDLHRVPYFKRGQKPPKHVRKGQHLKGTRYAHDYATLSLLRKGQYYVVAVTPCEPAEDWASLVRRLVRQAADLGFSPRYLLLDRGFWSADVFRYLQRARLPFTLPVPARGKGARAAGGPTGTQVFFGQRRSGRYAYTVHSRRGGRAATVTILVLRHRHADARGRQAWVYAQWGMRYAQLRWVHESYRRRFRIESSYRLLEAGRGRTNSRDEGWRLWYVVLAVLLVNLWLTLRREAARRGGPGERGRAWYVQFVAVLAHLLMSDALPPPARPAQAASSQGVPRGKRSA